MKLLRILCTSVVILLFAVAVPASAQRGPDKEKPQGKPAKQGRAAKPTPPPKAGYPAHMRAERDVRAWQDKRGWRHPEAWQEHATWREHQAKVWAREHRTWVQRGGYGGYYIPPDRFHLYFGPAHFFRIRTAPVVVTGYPRFQYRGYWFMFVDPWPEYWTETWYETDDVYIDYDDGYYLYNRRHPGVAIAVAVIL